MVVGGVVVGGVVVGIVVGVVVVGGDVVVDVVAGDEVHPASVRMAVIAAIPNFILLFIFITKYSLLAFVDRPKQVSDTTVIHSFLNSFPMGQVN